MALEAPLLNFSDLRERSGADACAFAEPQEERKRWLSRNLVLGGASRLTPGFPG